MISICLASYNGQKYIKEQIQSILKQIGQDDEIIISDDNSTDGTIEIIKEIKDRRIKLVHPLRVKDKLSKLELVTTNFENALSFASGEYIFLSDQDDVWFDNKINRMMYYLEDLGYDYVESDAIVTDENLNPISVTRFPNFHGFNKYKSLFGRTPFQGSAAAFNRKILKIALPFPPGIQSHDRWIGWIAFFKFKALILWNEKLFYYRRHDKNISSGINQSHQSLQYRIFTRLKYCVELYKRLYF